MSYMVEPVNPPGIRDLEASPHKILTDLLAWESWGFIKTPQWAYVYKDLGWGSIQTRWFIWRQLAQHFAREAGLPCDEDGYILPPPGSDCVFEEPPQLASEYAPPADPTGAK